MPDGNPAMTYLEAAIQMNAGPDKAANLERAERLVRVGAARGAHLVAVHEGFNWRRDRVARVLQLAEHADRAARGGGKAGRSISDDDLAARTQAVNPYRLLLDHRA